MRAGPIRSCACANASRARYQMRVVALAYLEIMAPDLPAAAAELCAAGCRSVIVVPVFLGQGGHVRDDLPALVQDAAARHPGCQFRLIEAAGEDDAVLDAIAAYCVRQISAIPRNPPR